LVQDDLRQDKERLKNLYREVKLARLVSHQNVARIFDIREWAGFEFITMEYINGLTLAQLLKNQGALQLNEGKRIFRQLCAGLSAAHLAGIIHGDLKTLNVMIETRGRVVILDFGLAHWMHTHTNIDPEPQAVRGTPYYMAPEQFRGEKTDQRTDIYALGLLAFEMFTGKRPFEDENLVNIALMHTEEPPPKPHELNPHIPPRLSAIILRCLEKAPKDRFSSVNEISAMVERDVLLPLN
jgi:serine/threonine-protein kinase